jgi:hypothetical protein
MGSGPSAWVRALALRLSRPQAPDVDSQVWRIDNRLVERLEMLGGARSNRAQARARSVLEGMWAAGPAHRTELWRTVWKQIGGSRFHFGSRHLPPPVVDFLLGDDTDSLHEPAVRLVAGLSIESPWVSGFDVASTTVAMARFHPDEETGRRVADLLSCTNQPVLLAALQNAFVEGLRECRYASSGGPAAVTMLWKNAGVVPGDVADAAPSRVLNAVLANRNLPVPGTDLADHEVDAAVVLMALRNRFDVLHEFDATVVVRSLVRQLMGKGLPAKLVETCRHALRSFPPGPLREAVCADVKYAEALAAVLDAGYRPAELEQVPLFLAETRQWERFLEIDPTAERLYTFCVRTASDEQVSMIPTLLDTAESDSAPAVARDVARRALHDIGPGAARDHLCYAATHGDAAALHAVVGAGHLPSDPEAVPAFLFLTGQWDGYNAADPDGALLRAYCANVLRYEFELEPFRVAAERAGRRSPCGPRPPPPRPQKYRPGGTGVAGTGGFSGFSF